MQPSPPGQELPTDIGELEARINSGADELSSLLSGGGDVPMESDLEEPMPMGEEPMAMEPEAPLAVVYDTKYKKYREVVIDTKK